MAERQNGVAQARAKAGAGGDGVATSACAPRACATPSAYIDMKNQAWFGNGAHARSFARS